MPSNFSQRVRRIARSLWRRPVSRAAGRPLFRPDLLCLEGRALRSTLTVTSLNDSGPGSLRYELRQADGSDTIAFAPGLHGTIALTSGELQVGKNVTINGPGVNVGHPPPRRRLGRPGQCRQPDRHRELRWIGKRSQRQHRVVIGPALSSLPSSWGRRVRTRGGRDE
jgi:hypothetical protein